MGEVWVGLSNAGVLEKEIRKETEICEKQEGPSSDTRFVSLKNSL